MARKKAEGAPKGEPERLPWEDSCNLKEIAEHFAQVQQFYLEGRHGGRVELKTWRRADQTRYYCLDTPGGVRFADNAVMELGLEGTDAKSLKIWLYSKDGELEAVIDIDGRKTAEVLLPKASGARGPSLLCKEDAKR